MPKHTRVTTCRKNGGPLSKHCSCEHCALDVCSVCGGGEGSLTTDCPGMKIDADRHQEICETSLDFTDARGWHLPEVRRSPRFENAAAEPAPRAVDPRGLIAPSIDWATVNRSAAFQHELASKAIAWVVADRTCEERAGALTRVEDEIKEQVAAGNAPADLGSLLDKLEAAKVDFHLADQRAQCCDDEFRQAARVLVAALEEPLARKAQAPSVNERALTLSLSAAEALVIVDALEEVCGDKGSAFMNEKRAKPLQAIAGRLTALAEGGR